MNEKLLEEVYHDLNAKFNPDGQKKVGFVCLVYSKVTENSVISIVANSEEKFFQPILKRYVAMIKMKMNKKLRKRLN